MSVLKSKKHSCETASDCSQAVIIDLEQIRCKSKPGPAASGGIECKILGTFKSRCCKSEDIFVVLPSGRFLTFAVAFAMKIIMMLLNHVCANGNICTKCRSREVESDRKIRDEV